MITHVSLLDLYRLAEIFTYFTPEGWQLPEWLSEMALNQGVVPYTLLLDKELPCTSS